LFQFPKTLRNAARHAVVVEKVATSARGPQKSGHRVALVPVDPGRAQVRGHVLHRRGPGASTDSVTCFHNGHPVSPVGQLPGAGQPGKTGAHDGDVPSPAAAVVGTNPSRGPTPTEHGPGRGRGCLVAGRLTREVQTGTD